jgi:hypothetical protein
VIAGAHGHAGAIEHGADVVRMRSLGNEGHDRAAAFEHAHAGQRLQPRRRLRPQRSHVRIERRTTERLDGFGRRRQPDGAGHVGRAAFQARRQRRPAHVLEADMLDHVAAHAQRREPLERLAPPSQHADAHGPVHLVPGQRQEVAAQQPQRRHLVRRGLGRVEHGERAGLVRQRHHRLVRRSVAGGVGTCGERQHPGARAEQLGQRSGGQRAVALRHQYTQARAAAPRRAPPRQQVGVVLQRRDDDLVARPQPGLAIGVVRQAEGDLVERIGGAAAKHHFMRRIGAEVGRQRGARGLVGVGSLLAARMHAAVDVGAAVEFEVLHRLHHLARHLRTGGVVQVHQAAAVHLPLESGKVGAHALQHEPITHHGLRRRRSRAAASA